MVLETRVAENTVLSALFVFVILGSIVNNMVWETQVAANTVLYALVVFAILRFIVKNNVLRHMDGTQYFLLCYYEGILRCRFCKVFTDIDFVL